MERDRGRFSIPEILHSHAADCEQLADNMCKEGRPLNMHERALVKSACSEMVCDMCDQIGYVILHDASPTNEIEELMSLAKTIKEM